MSKRSAMSAIGLALLLSTVSAYAEEEAKTIAAKSGETIDVMPVYGAAKCRSTLVATPEVEVLQGPPELKLSVREDMVSARNCPNKVKGGFVVATVGQIKQPVESKLTFRVKYKTKDGTRQTGHVYNVSLFP